MISFPPSLEKIGNSSFLECSDLSLIFFPINSKLKEICGLTFKLAKIRSVSFPKSLGIIGDESFHYCRKLKTISFPEDSMLKSIGCRAFSERVHFKLE